MFSRLCDGTGSISPNLDLTLLERPKLLISKLFLVLLCFNLDSTAFRFFYLVFFDKTSKSYQRSTLFPHQFIYRVSSSSNLPLGLTQYSYGWQVSVDIIHSLDVLNVVRVVDQLGRLKHSVLS